MMTTAPVDLTTAKTYAILEDALRKGNMIHAFLSGGGLRVIRIEKSRHGALLGYGEHPVVDEALRHAAEDFAAGGRPYEKVYGSKALYPHYLTGQSAPEGPLDTWVRQGNTFDVRFRLDSFEVDLRGWGKRDVPVSVQNRAMKGEVVEWDDDRGCRFQTGPFQFANGDTGCSTRVLSKPSAMPEHRVWMWHAKQVGLATSLMEAFDLALKATPVETPEDP
jgi:hypothetical protein